MAEEKCEKCEKELEENAKNCPECESAKDNAENAAPAAEAPAELSAEELAVKKQKAKMIRNIIGIVCLLIVIGLFFARRPLYKYIFENLDTFASRMKVKKWLQDEVAKSCPDCKYTFSWNEGQYRITVNHDKDTFSFNLALKYVEDRVEIEPTGLAEDDPNDDGYDKFLDHCNMINMKKAIQEKKAAKAAEKEAEAKK